MCKTKFSLYVQSVLAAILLVSVIAPTGAFARRRKGPVYDNILDFGSCGRHLFWKYENGVLKVRGFGPMDNYANASEVPYAPFAPYITQVQLSDSVTSIGANAFAQCLNLQSINIPRYVNRIGKRAFANCVNLQQIAVSSYVD
ncbi:MAG: leucine-rich repeat domain-containing protein, partial [Bacteroidales bacterium]|nr:leucine-rich repeat domain-containing protein [Bacteroidales bacterium]